MGWLVSLLFAAVPHLATGRVGPFEVSFELADLRRPFYSCLYHTGVALSGPGTCPVDGTKLDRIEPEDHLPAGVTHRLGMALFRPGVGAAKGATVKMTLTGPAGRQSRTCIGQDGYYWTDFKLVAKSRHSLTTAIRWSKNDFTHTLRFVP